MSPEGRATSAVDTTISTLRDRIMPLLQQKFPDNKGRLATRADIACEAKAAVAAYLNTNHLELNLLDQRDLVTSIVNGFMSGYAPAAASPANVSLSDLSSSPAKSDTLQNLTTANVELDAPLVSPSGSRLDMRTSSRGSVDQAKLKLQPIVLERIDTSAAAKMSREDLSRDLTGLVADLLIEQKIQLNAAERQDLVAQLLNDMLGLGPLEPLLADETISESWSMGPNKFTSNKKAS
jgi:pilus assembly protein CpaF